ncbi:la-related protein 6-like [Maniola hyperantus]|uniref:la-related protein 6-like n=1 Tax=Aphantopus hyperantus TaxID=2795564 RepID=UPI0015682096|nr:la-related protein 6 [Maniola hyperantus]
MEETPPSQVVPEPDEGIASDRRPSTDDNADLSDSASDAGSGGGKDSGCEVAPDAQEPPYAPPDDELAARIVAQVEFYFSDANITKDAFLLKHVRRNKEGYVSLKLISSFKRVKHLTKDWRVVAEALKRSTKLEINEQGTKLRRIDPLPAYDETTPSRTVVAVRMPIERPSVENVSRLFASCGEIALVRVLRPGNPVPADVRQFLNKNPSLVNCVCALVEFTESEAARGALRLQSSDEEGMRVYELNGVPREPKRKTPVRRPAPRRHECEYSSCCSGSEAEYESYRYGTPPFYRRNSSGFFAPRSPEIQTWVPRRTSTCSHSSDSGVSFFCGSRRASQASTGSASSAEGWLARRLSGCSLTGPECGGRRVSCTPRFEPRAPVVPDGTRGFHAAARQRRISDLALYSR